MSDSPPWSHNLRPTAYDFSEDESIDSEDAPSAPTQIVALSAATENIEPSLPQQRETSLTASRADPFHQAEDDLKFIDTPFTIARRQAAFRRQRALTNGNGQAVSGEPPTKTSPAKTFQNSASQIVGHQLYHQDLSGTPSHSSPALAAAKGQIYSWATQQTPLRQEAYVPLDQSSPSSSSARLPRFDDGSTPFKTSSNSTDTALTQKSTSPLPESFTRPHQGWHPDEERHERCSYESKQLQASLAPTQQTAASHLQRKEFPALKPAHLALSRHERDADDRRHARQLQLRFRPPTRDSHAFSSAISPPSLVGRPTSNTGSWLSDRSGLEESQVRDDHDVCASPGSSRSWSPLSLHHQGLYSTSARFAEYQSPLPSFALPFSTPRVVCQTAAAEQSRFASLQQNDDLVTSPWFSRAGNGQHQPPQHVHQPQGVLVSDCITISDSDTEEDDNHSQVFAYDPNRDNVALVPNHFLPESTGQFTSPQTPQRHPFSHVHSNFYGTESWVVEELDNWRGAGKKRSAPVEAEVKYEPSHTGLDYDEAFPSSSASQRLNSFSYSPTGAGQRLLQPDDNSTIRAHKRRQHVHRAVPPILQGLTTSSSPSKARPPSSSPTHYSIQRARNAPSARGKAIALKRFRLPVLPSHRLSAPIPKASSTPPLRQVDTNAYGMRRLKVPPGMQVQMETQQLGVGEGGGARRLTLFKPSPLKSAQTPSGAGGV